MWGTKRKVVKSYRMPPCMVRAMERLRLSPTDIVIAAVDEWLKTNAPRTYQKAKLETDENE